MQQPVHTVYGGANLFKANTSAKLQGLAKRAFEEFAPTPETFSAMGVPAELAVAVHLKVADKLARNPVEDYRIDFEDGYGYRSDEEEDAAARNAAAHVQAATPQLMGIRIKPLSPLLRDRALRTLRIFQDAATNLPEGFVVTLPKVTSPEQIAELIKETSLPIEAMIETPSALRQLPEIVQAARGRCRGVHFGPYDYLSNLGIAGTARGLGHPACHFARSTMQVELADTGIWLSDGPTSTIPVPPKETIERAWKLHYANVRQALDNGFYQGWDLHPAQFIPRYAAVYAFLLEGLDEASTRLKNFSDEAGQATRIGATFDDAATAEGLLLYVKRAVSCGATTLAEVSVTTGLSVEELSMTSFVHIMQARNTKRP